MNDDLVDDPAVADAIKRAYVDEWAYVLAATVRVTADLDLAEECVQSAFARAVVAWRESGVPERPGAWLTTTARRAAVDVLRRESRLRDRLPLLVDAESDPVTGWSPRRAEDDRLRLIFTCCHPALAVTSQIALTLRLVCALRTSEVARAFLVSEPTMAARLTRAKRKISQARIPYRAPNLDELPERLPSVLHVIHLVFTTGHAAPGGDELLRVDLIERATALARMLRELLPDDPDVAGLLALILLTDARRSSRLSSGELVLLADQDRSAWNKELIAEGSYLVDESLAAPKSGIYVQMAAIAREHSCASRWESTNWSAIVEIYDRLLASWPSPVISLNRAVARSFADGPDVGLSELNLIGGDPQLATYPYLAVARADMYRRLGDNASATRFYEEALALTENGVERNFIERRLAELHG